MAIDDRTGWFAAGYGLREAFCRLSDGAFRMFYYICVNAPRTTGTYTASRAQPAKEISRSRNSVTGYVDELKDRGFCEVRHGANQHEFSTITVCDPYWPYSRESKHTPSDAQSFLAALRKILAERKCVRTRFANVEQEYALALKKRGVTLQQITRAIDLSCFRKYASLISRQSGDLIVSFLYFQDTIEELVHPDQNIAGDTAQAYWEHVREKMLAAEREWAQLNQKRQ